MREISYIKTLDCILFGNNCKRDIYDYYFVYDDEKIKADFCYTSIFGKSRCSLDDKFYDNVSYEKNYIRTESYESHGLYGYFLLFLIVLGFIVLVRYFIIRYF